MACLDMYKNPDHKAGHCPSMTARLSFSNDFVDSHHQSIKEDKSESSNIISSSDFEFTSVTNHSMTTADELFFKGRLLPTLRDELLVDDDDDDVSFVPAMKAGSNAPRWKGFLGLKRGHGGYVSSKMCDAAAAGAEGKMLKLIDENDVDVDVDGDGVAMRS